MKTDIKKKILVVEDDLTLRDLIKTKLDCEGFSILLAKNGLEGLEVALANWPDLILLDILMPIMNGIDMLKKLREDKWGKVVPVILFTNDSNPDYMLDALKNNATDYLTKADWDLNSVVKVIKTRVGM